MTITLDLQYVTTNINVQYVLERVNLVMEVSHPVGADVVELDDVADDLLDEDFIELEAVLRVCRRIPQDVYDIPDLN